MIAALIALLLGFSRSISINQNITDKGQLFVSLNWLDREEDRWPTFRVFKSKNGEPFQSISTIDLQRGDEVCNVLNVYPATGKKTTFKYLNGSVIEGLTDQSAALKIFMEGGMNKTGESSWASFDPYGAVNISASRKQIINVTPKSFPEFKKDPLMIWKYDVVYFGAWDAYANVGSGENRPNEYELQIIEDYLDAGYGVLLGHDTVLPTVGVTKGFGPLAKRLNIILGGGTSAIPNDSNIRLNYNSKKVKMVRKGQLSQYPWVLNGTMIIPAAHTTSQFVTTRNDVWFEFYDGNILQTDVNYIEANKLGNAIFYLTSSNNVAMIQTGHSNGESSSDERKILANTLFYLKQRSSNTYVNDFNANDEEKPDAPIEVSKEITTDAQKHIKLSLKLKGKDNGATYTYVIKGYNLTMGLQYTSTNTTISIISGLKHFAYSFDDKATTTADKLVNTATVVAIGGNSGAAKVIKGDIDSSTNGNNQNVVNGIVEGEGTIEIENIEQLKPSGTTSNTFKMYLHAACVDNKNLASEITNIAVDITIPVDPPTTIEVIKPPTEEVKPPTEVVKPPTEVVKPPTEVIKPPTEVIKPPTEVIKPPTEVIRPPTEEIPEVIPPTKPAGGDNEGGNSEEQNKGGSGKKDNTGTIVGAVVGVVAGLAGAAAATALVVNACKPPIPILPYFGNEEEEEEDVNELDFYTNDMTQDEVSANNSEYYNVIRNSDEMEPYENEV